MSYFDMPAGYNDADMEMASLVEAGNRHARRTRKWGEAGYAALQAGETITTACRSKATNAVYKVRVRLDDDDPRYTVDGRAWFGTARDAHDMGRTPCELRPLHDPWMSDPTDADHLAPDARWCIRCGCMDTVHALHEG